MKNIIIIGMKNSGKSTVSKKLAEYYKMELIKMDDIIEQIHKKEKNETLKFREIHKKYGREYFLNLERAATKELQERHVQNAVIDTAGGIPMQKENQPILKKLGTIILLDVDKDILFDRIMQNGIPAFFKYQDDPGKSYEELLQERIPIYKMVADIIIDSNDESPDEIVKKIIDLKLV